MKSQYQQKTANRPRNAGKTEQARKKARTLLLVLQTEGYFVTGAFALELVRSRSPGRVCSQSAMSLGRARKKKHYGKGRAIVSKWYRVAGRGSASASGVEAAGTGGVGRVGGRVGGGGTCDTQKLESSRRKHFWTFLNAIQKGI